MDSYRLFGQAMLAYLRDGQGRFTFVRDDGHRDPSDVKSYFAPFSRWSQPERRAIRYARGNALDVGCGPGRVALYLQRRGLAVTAIDVSPEAVECARLRGVRDARTMDARGLSFAGGSFDTIVMFGNNFGMCGDIAATKRFLRRAHRIARPRGRLLASTGIPAVWAKPHATYVKRNVRRGLPPGLIRLRILFKGNLGDWFPLLFLGTDDMVRICTATGWAVEEVFLEPRDRSHYAFTAVRA
jgi:SAM-dependent methyltransferase